MKQPADRRRMLWFAAVGAAVLLGVLFVAALKPPSAADDSTVLRPDEGFESATTSAPAAASGTQATAGGGGFSLGGGQAISLLWRLGLVAVILGISVAGLRWWGKRANGPRSGTGFLRVIDTLAISNGRTIHLVALGDRVIAVGATAQQLTFLNELEPGEAAHVLAGLLEQDGQPIAAFAAELFRSMRSNAIHRGPVRDEILAEELP